MHSAIHKLGYCCLDFVMTPQTYGKSVAQSLNAYMAVGFINYYFCKQYGWQSDY